LTPPPLFVAVGLGGGFSRDILIPQGLESWLLACPACFCHGLTRVPLPFTGALLAAYASIWRVFLRFRRYSQRAPSFLFCGRPAYRPKHWLCHPFAQFFQPDPPRPLRSPCKVARALGTSQFMYCRFSLQARISQPRRAVEFFIRGSESCRRAGVSPPPRPLSMAEARAPFFASPHGTACCRAENPIPFRDWSARKESLPFLFHLALGTPCLPEEEFKTG